MKSPNKKKLKSGISSTVGGKLGGTSYKTASPYNIKINNMITNNLSPLTQAEGGPQTISGGQITQTKEGFVYSPGEGMEPIPVQDPKELITGDGSTDYLYEESENGDLIVVDVAGVGKGEKFEKGVPGTPPGPGAAGMGVPQGGM